jgi:hypothetical protein
MLTANLLLFLGCVLLADGGSLAPLVGDVATLQGAAEAFTKTLQDKQQGIFKVTEFNLQSVQVHTAWMLMLADRRTAQHQQNNPAWIWLGFAKCMHALRFFDSW